MKRKLDSLKRFILGIAIASGLAMSTNTASAGLIAHWKFDDSLKDETGNHNGEPIDADTGVFYEDGLVGSGALSITGHTEAVQVENHETIELSGAFTISAFVKTAGGAGEQMVLYQGSVKGFGNGGDDSKQFELYGGGGLNAADGENGAFFHSAQSGAFGSSWKASHDIDPFDGEWHHIVWTYDVNRTPNLVHMYLDGVEKTADDPGLWRDGWKGTVALKADDTTRDDVVMRIGSRDDGGGGYTAFIGAIDDVQIYNIALTAEEVQYINDNPGDTIQPPVGPEIMQRPSDISVLPGESGSLTVSAEGSSDFNFQWQKNGQAIAGATDKQSVLHVPNLFSSTLSFADVKAEDAAVYTVVVSSADTTVTAEARVFVAVDPEITVQLHPGIKIDGAPGFEYRVDYTDSLTKPVVWTELVTLTLATSQFIVFDQDPATHPQRFYRTVLLGRPE